MSVTEADRPHGGGGARGWVLLLVLAGVQFTHIVDFMILLPLGPRCLREMAITPAQFSLLVSAYAFSAFASGLLAATVIDRYDRKRAVLVLYSGFALGTLACGLARSFPALLAARSASGAFGGILGAVILAVEGDVFPEDRRGLAMGVLMSAFSVATIVGVPAGLFLADDLGTGAPFLALAGLSAALLLVASWVLPPLRAHLHGGHRSAGWQVLTRPEHLRAYLLMACLVLSTFTIVPFLATFLVTNVGWTEGQLRWLYLCGGGATLVTLSVFGRLADRFGKLPVFRILAVLTAVPMVILSNLGRAPLVPVLVLTTAFMVFSSGRMVPAMALITSSSARAYRGSFMSINASVQQLTTALASLIAGVLVTQAGEGAPLEGFPAVGAVSCLAIAASLFLAGRLHPVAADEAPLHDPGALLAESSAATVPLPETVEGIP